MPAVGVLALELGWAIDFLAGGRLIGLAAYTEMTALPLMVFLPTHMILLRLFG